MPITLILVMTLIQDSAFKTINEKGFLSKDEKNFEVERIENFLNIPQHKIGVIGQGKFKLGEQITVATIQSLPKYIEEIKNEFGTIIVDECHHISAENYRSIVNDLSCYYLYGITATPFRKNSDEKMIFIYLGDIIGEINPHEIKGFKHPEIIIRNTLFDIPYNSKTDELEILSKNI